MKEFDAGQFREEGHRLIDKLADYLGSISKGEGYPVLPVEDPDVLYQLFLTDEILYLRWPQGKIKYYILFRFLFA